MTRDDIKQDIISLKGNNWLLELPTGTGKSKAAIDKIKSLKLKKHSKMLIVVPRNVLKQNWELEINKWWKTCNLNINYTTYVSFPKYKGDWDIVIYDECHHLSDRCREAIKDFNVRYSILLSATVNENLKDSLRGVFNNLTVYKKTLRNIINYSILPDPKVYIWAIDLKEDFPTECIHKNPRAKGLLIECSWANRWHYIKQKEYPVNIYCNEKQYYSDLCSQIDYWKRTYTRTRREIAKNKWLRLCNDRLKWLSDKKIKHLYKLFKSIDKYRTLIFCNSIEQTELLGEYCINSKNKKSLQYLRDFNNGKINHITACNMINEGLNLINCQIGIYANLNSSESIIKQRCGRLLRHPNPIIIIPYFRGTREEELVPKMLEDYNPLLITNVNSVEEIEL